MAVPNGVRPDKAQTLSAEDTRAAEDNVSEADSAGWETASDEDDTDASLSQAEATANTSGAKSAEDAIRQTSASGAQSSLDTPATPSRGAESSVREITSNEASSAQDTEEWDLKRSFFDNHMSSSMEANLEYMFKHFGFYLPDAEYLSDPAGLIKYLVSHSSLCTVLSSQTLQFAMSSILLVLAVLFKYSLHEVAVAE